LLAELVNAMGDAEGALQLMREVRNWQSSFRPPDYVAHMRVLEDAEKTRMALVAHTKAFVTETALRSLGPVRPFIDPTAAGLLDVVNTLAALEKVKVLEPPKFDPAPSVSSEPSAPAPQEPSRPWTPEWRQIAVSFVAGAVIATLLSLQLRELRKRRQQQDAEPASRG
jgi:hypothetical protein